MASETTPPDGLTVSPSTSNNNATRAGGDIPPASSGSGGTSNDAVDGSRLGAFFTTEEETRLFIKCLKEACQTETVKSPLPEYLRKEISIKDAEKLKSKALIDKMKTTYEANLKKWMRFSKHFKMANLFVTVLVILMQVAEVILFQIPLLKGKDFFTAIGSIFPAITGAILALQLKLNWTSKAKKAKKNAYLYQQLLLHVQYRENIIDAEAVLSNEDTVKLWNVALQAEIENVPPFLSFL